MTDDNDIKKVKKVVSQKEESQRNWEALSEPPVGIKSQAAYFNHGFANRFIIFRTIARWLGIEKLESSFDAGVKFLMGPPPEKK